MESSIYWTSEAYFKFLRQNNSNKLVPQKRIAEICKYKKQNP